MFERLNLAVTPKLGRAVCWTNTNPDGSGHPETRHEAVPLQPGAEKWVIQLWFRRYPMMGDPPRIPAVPQARPGVPLNGDEDLPDGAWSPGPLDPAAVYGDAGTES